MTEKERDVYKYIAISVNTEFSYRHFGNKKENRTVTLRLVYILRAYKEAVKVF